MEIRPGQICRIRKVTNYLIAEARPFLDRDVEVVKTTKAGLIQVCLPENRNMTYSFARSDIVETRYTKEDVLEMIDICFHAFASSLRGEARELVSEIMRLGEENMNSVMTYGDMTEERDMRLRSMANTENAKKMRDCQTPNFDKRTFKELCEPGIKEEGQPIRTLKEYEEYQKELRCKAKRDDDMVEKKNVSDCRGVIIERTGKGDKN